VGVQVRTFAVAAIEAVGRVPDGEEDQAALDIDRGEAPLTRAATIPPAFRTPGIAAGFAGLRNGVEAPQKLAGANVEATRIAAGTEAWTLLRARTDDQHVAIDDRRRGHTVRRARKLVCDPGAKIERAVIAKCLRGRPGLRVQRNQPAVAGT